MCFVLLCHNVPLNDNFKNKRLILMGLRGCGVTWLAFLVWDQMIPVQKALFSVHYATGAVKVRAAPFDLKLRWKK